MKGKLILIEGTDCSGKETQSNLLIEKLNNDNINVAKFSFPNYDSPTGKIIAGPYLGKSYVCEGWFPETAPNVDPKVSSLYYAADRKYNINEIEKFINNGVNVVVDRYVYSNFAHQGGKLKNKKDRLKMYKWLEKLEFKLLELPEPDIKIYLHLPYEDALKLKQAREEAPDQNEASKEHLLMAEKAYNEVASLYDFKKVECSINNNIRSIEDINDELYEFVKSRL